MGKKRESGADRLKKLPLWQWGAIVIFSGVVTNAMIGLQPLPSNPAAARGQQLGRGIATLLFVAGGTGLMIYDLLIRKKPAEDQRKSAGRKKRPPVE